MAKNLARQLKDDDFFGEPDYDKLSDEELDDLYNFGEIRSASKSQKTKVQAKSKQAKPSWSPDDEKELLDIDLDVDADLDIDAGLDVDEDLYGEY